MDNESRDCLDCVREKANPPRKRYKRTSYCLQHNSHRSQAASKNARLKRIIADRAWEQLEQLDRFGAPVFSYADLEKATVRWKEEADAASKRADGVPKDQRIAGNIEFEGAYDTSKRAYETYLALTLRRRPTKQEMAVIPSWILPPDPDELRRIDRMYVEMVTKEGRRHADTEEVVIVEPGVPDVPPNTLNPGGWGRT